MNTNYVVRLVECAEKFMRIVVDCGGESGGEFVENAGVKSHYDETGKRTDDTKFSARKLMCANRCVVFFFEFCERSSDGLEKYGIGL